MHRVCLCVCVLVCVNVGVDVPEVSLKLLINDNDDDNVLISEYDKVTFVCSAIASPPALTWKYVFTQISLIIVIIIIIILYPR